LFGGELALQKAQLDPGKSTEIGLGRLS
jgi:hypothetical protein